MMVSTWFMGALLLNGCISRNNHELVVMQLDATRVALSANTETFRADMGELKAAIAKREREIQDRQNQLNLLDANHTHLQLELDEMRLEYAELLAIISTPAEPAPIPRKKPRRRRNDPVEPPPAPPDIHPGILASIADMEEALQQTQESNAEALSGADRHQAVVDAFEELVTEGWLKVLRQDGATVIVIPVAKTFQEGRTTISPRGEDILTRSATALNTLHGYTLEIQGHTDNKPFHSARHASNWELAFGEAIEIMRLLEDLNVEHPMHTSSWADRRPVASNDTPAGQKLNRRVELWLTEPPLMGKMFTPVAPPEEAPEEAPVEEAPVETPEEAPVEEAPVEEAPIETPAKGAEETPEPT